MAEVSITHQWPDGSVTNVDVEFEDSYPDAMARAMDEALRGMGVLTVDEDDE